MNAFSRTCKYTYNNFNLRLYQHIIRTPGCDELIKNALVSEEKMTVKRLLEAGLDPSNEYCDETTPLMAAAWYGRTENARILLDAGADLHVVRPHSGNSAISLTVDFGHAETMSLLLERGCSADFRFHNTPALTYAAMLGFGDVVKVLLAHNIDVDEVDRMTPGAPSVLGYAIRGGHYDMMQRLIRAGANINSVTLSGQNLLHFAAEGGNVEAVAYLLEKGLDPHAKEDYGTTPLICACRAFHFRLNVNVMKLFLERNVDVDAKDRNERTALSYAADRGFIEGVEVLLHHNADITTTDDMGNTPLILAARKGYASVVLILLAHAKEKLSPHEFKQYIDQPDNRGRTPLFSATLYAEQKVVEVLLCYGSIAKSTPTCAGRTPLSTSTLQLRAEGNENNESILQIWDLLHNQQVYDMSSVTEITALEDIDSVDWESWDATCDRCQVSVSPADTHFHCNVCNEDDFDICQECAAHGETCYNRTHVWEKIRKMGTKWRVVSRNLEQESIVEELASIRVS
ncbi:hypothetical protein N7532_005316 [Penicillium argentinense]|uniref:Uncharacterized protein n=1 Tax=Penicillium argentinense TaxID=1131581 RepID=A0A9W9FDN8_9EURO|nr:uncharacterized protein N7532_005316 [Penicillium argentinense]KAJ5098315.1 hypothetical protein N7532_005316 [Penicillium argentinense]